MKNALRAALGISILLLLAIAGVWAAARVLPGYTLDLGPREWGRIQNSNDWEEHGSFTYRWTRGWTSYRLPALGTPRVLTLRLDGSRPAGIDPAAVTVSLDGHPVATFTPPPGPAVYQIAYDIPSGWRWETDVRVSTTPFQVPGDDRELGVVVDLLHFSPPLRALGPQWTLALLAWALGLAVAFLGRSLGWPWPNAGVLGIAAILFFCALLALNRPVALPWGALLLAVALLGLVAARFLSRKRAPWAVTVASWESTDVPVEKEGPDGRPTLFAYLCLGLAVLVAVLPLLSPWLRGEKSWALHMLEPWYPAGWPVPRSLEPLLPLLVVALVAVPGVNRDLRELVRGLLATGERLAPRLVPAGRWLLMGLLFIPFEYLLRARILWGDGPHLISRLSAGYAFREPEMLPFFVQAMLYRLGGRAWGWDVPTTYIITGLAAGALYVALAAALGDTLGRTRFERGFIFGLLATLATIEFGFGYLENYAFVTVALLAVFWQMIRCLRGAGSPAVLVALWVVAVACHLQALLVGPAVLYTVIHVWKESPATWWRKAAGTAAAGLLPATALMAVFYAGGYDLNHLWQGAWVQGNDAYTLVPLHSTTTYTLFSLTHLANLVNEHLMVAPIVLPLLVLLVLYYRRRVPWRDPVLWALALGAGGLLLFACTFYPDLSAATDWDLFAAAALPYTLLTGFLFTRAVPEGGGKRYAGAVLLVAAAMHAGMWVLQNAMLL